MKLVQPVFDLRASKNTHFSQCFEDFVVVCYCDIVLLCDVAQACRCSQTGKPRFKLQIC